ncbi:MAG: potassium channel family protein [Candidatus Aminicenantes bacterium]|jgi:uncharacterized protein YjbI with pentapeptide repeats
MVLFEEAQFFQKAHFKNAEFSGEADFRYANFSWNGNFYGAQFSGKADFYGAEFYARNEKLDDAIDGSVTPVTQISVKFSAKKFWEGMKIIVGTNDNNGSGFEITAIDFETKTLTISPEVKDTQADDALVRGWIPQAELSTSNFSNTKFSEIANFGQAQFGGEVHFTGAEFFKHAYFNGFRFRRKVTFREVKFYKKVEFQNIIADEDINNLSFEFTYFFSEKGLFDFIKNNKKEFKRSKKTKLEFLPDNFKLILGEDVAARDPITTRKVRDDMFLLKFKEEHRCGFKFWWLFADCGRSFWRWATWCFGVACFFGFVFWGMGTENFQIPKGHSPFAYFYYSIVTFTTLGFGDIVPMTLFGRILVTFEVILGYIGLGGLISIFANKLARRS